MRAAFSTCIAGKNQHGNKNCVHDTPTAKEKRRKRLYIRVASWAICYCFLMEIHIFGGWNWKQMIARKTVRRMWAKHERTLEFVFAGTCPTLAHGHTLPCQNIPLSNVNIYIVFLVDSVFLTNKLYVNSLIQMQRGDFEWISHFRINEKVMEWHTQILDHDPFHILREVEVAKCVYCICMTQIEFPRIISARCEWKLYMDN